MFDLQILTLDERYELAEDHNIEVAILRELLKDENPYISCRAEKTLKRLDSVVNAPTYWTYAFNTEEEALQNTITA